MHGRCTAVSKRETFQPEHINFSDSELSDLPALLTELKGRTKTTLRREFEVSCKAGSVYRRIVAENGVAIGPNEAEKKKVQVRREVMALSTIASQTTKKLLGEKAIDGRMCWVVQSESATDRNPKRWTLWIDENERAIVRVESDLLRGTPEVKAGAPDHCVVQQERAGFLASEPADIAFHRQGILPARALQTIDFSSYRRFTTTRTSSTTIRINPTCLAGPRLRMHDQYGRLGCPGRRL